MLLMLLDEPNLISVVKRSPPAAIDEKTSPLKNKTNNIEMNTVTGNNFLMKSMNVSLGIIVNDTKIVKVKIIPLKFWISQEGKYGNVSEVDATRKDIIMNKKNIIKYATDMYVLNFKL
ncbi:hypothetical protein BCU83_18015 [Vibrio breoganii]|nr:hypothetical protein BCU93_14895 [Vibrio breoganii]PMG74955.1 hypothetical protein BCU83_18015 [Vibrio breoganii]PMM49066.1 hypothetical protein BCT52_03950 [Vibrio breoganii]